MATDFTHTTTINVPADFAFQWHERPGSFERLAPPWETLRLERKTGGLEDGAELVFRVRLAPGIWKTWKARHFDYIPGEQFCDEQVQGPFASWNHVHRFESIGDKQCQITDHVTYELPLEPAAQFGPAWLVGRKVEAMFRYRSETVKNDLERLYHTPLKPMKVAITGASGLIGSSLIPFLKSAGHDILPITRSPKGKGEQAVFWDSDTGIPEEERQKLEGVDAVIHLAGENIFGLWTSQKKARIRNSRVRGTRRLCEALAALSNKPKVLLSSSAVGIYGNRGEEELTESAERGTGFLADVGAEWEEAANMASEAGIRVVNLRTSTVLSPRGGALGAMHLPFNLGLGARLGSGNQWMSWISIDDLIYLVHFLLATESVSGPVNAASPNPVTNAEFTRAIASALDRPAILPAPEFVLKAAAGEMAEEMLLSSTRVVPEKVQQAGFRFSWPNLDTCLRHLFGKK